MVVCGGMEEVEMAKVSFLVQNDFFDGALFRSNPPGGFCREPKSRA